jgi:hypothetical protein
MKITAIKKEQAAILESANGERLRHRTVMEQLSARKTELERLEKMLMGGLDLERILRAEKVISIRGEFINREKRESNYGDQGAVQDAIEDLARGAPVLKERFFGTKDYSGWTHQREDCSYGYGPKHGGIVFAVELNQEFRGDRVLTAEEIDDAVYLLVAMQMDLYKNRNAKAG